MNDYKYAFLEPGCFARGWHIVAFSRELAIGEVQRLHYFNRDLVLFRGESGRAAVVDAHCPHLGAHLASVGKEFGSVTGRARRTGWFDGAALKRSVQLNGITGLCITKLDVLDGLETVSLGVGYRIDGQFTELLPFGAAAVAKAEPVMEEMPGWSDSTVGVTQFEDLPENARRYLLRIAQLCEVPIDMVSTGPDRDETILLRHPFKS
jgi:adenylosuccinate synthase